MSKEIGYRAFQNDANINDLTIEDGVEYIGQIAFGGCIGLQKNRYTGKCYNNR